MKFLSLGLFFFAVGNVLAQSGDEINRPIFNVGDSWSYSQTDLWKNELQPGTATISVKKIKESQINFRGTNREGKNWSETVDHDLNFHYKLKGEPYTNAIFSWPLIKGKNWKTDRKFAVGEVEVDFEGQCEVGAVEKVTVPAGEFVTTKIACKNFFNNTAGGFGSTEYLRWYSPDVKRHVRSETRTWYGSRLDTQVREELVEYHLGNAASPAQ